MKILKPKFWEKNNNLISLLLLPVSFILQILIIIKTKHGKDNNAIILENIRKISIEFEKYILKINPNCIIALGDRYELLGISLVNIFYNQSNHFPP